MALVPGELAEHLHHFVPHHWVQPRGGLVQNEQFGVVGQGHRNAQLHLHALGILLKGAFFREIQLFEILSVQLFIPLGIGVSHDFSHLHGAQARGNAHLVQHHPDVLLGQEHILPVVPAQEGDGALVPVNHVQNQLNGGALARSILTDEAHDTPTGQGEIQVVQGKLPVVFG